MNDEEQIRRLQATYAQITDDGDPKAKSDLFAEDAKYCPPSGEVIGRKAIYETLVARAATQAKDRQSKHMCGNSVIKIAGDSAEAATDYVLYQRTGDSP